MIEALSKIALGDDNINITFITDTIKNLYVMLENFELDILIIEEKPTNPDFNFMVIDTDMLMCMVSSQNPIAQKPAITLNDLKKQHLILRLPTSATREKFANSLEAIGESIDNFDVIIEVDSISTIKNLVKKDVGVSILSKSACMKELRKKSLVALPIENLSMTRETTIVYHKTFNHVEIIERIATAYQEIAKQ
ncbi:MAG: LysR substrate-binding domain-containing protein [Christensenella sp.]|nr:MAG: LysR substrate-binding domain-containing protein [Christensenella sp.]